MHSARYYIGIGFCCFFIILGLLGILTPLFPKDFVPAPSDAQPDYWLRDYNGRIAVYDSPDQNAVPIAIHDIYVNLLPECDVLRLKAGMVVHGPTALQRTLEDLGL